MNPCFLLELELRSLPAPGLTWPDLQLSCDVQSMADRSAVQEGAQPASGSRSAPPAVEPAKQAQQAMMLHRKPQQAFSRQPTLFNQNLGPLQGSGMRVSIHGRREPTSGDFRKRRRHHQTKQLSFF